MLRKAAFFSLSLALLALAGCTYEGDFKNPFEKEPPFVATPVPADLAIVVDENHDTYYARQHIQQVITANDTMSRTTYTMFRDYNNVVSNKFSQETPLSAVQLQNIWNDISRARLLSKSRLWVNWLSDSDLYKRDTFTIQIRANGRSATYRQAQGFSGAVRPVMLQLEALRLPMSQDSRTPVVGGSAEPAAPQSQPALVPEAETMPASQPAMSEPATMPAQ